MNPLSIDADLPPAARHVAHCLQEEGPLTRQELVDMTSLPERTVADALERLVANDLAGYRQEWRDARRRRYHLIE